MGKKSTIRYVNHCLNLISEGGIDKGHNMDLSYLIPLTLGIMMILSIFKQFNWHMFVWSMLRALLV